MTGCHIRRFVAPSLLAIAIAASAGACTADEPAAPGPEPDAAPRSAAPAPGSFKETDGLFHGVYVGRAAGSRTLLAVSALPPGPDGNRQVTVFVSDGDTVFEYFAGAEATNLFDATSGDGDARARGRVIADAVVGTLRLGSGRPLRFTLARATGAAGLYDLEIAAKGQLSGASAAGVGATGTAPLTSGRKGHLDLADGRRVDFTVDEAPRRSLPDQQAWLIVLPDGDVAGVVRGSESALALRS